MLRRSKPRPADGRLPRRVSRGAPRLAALAALCVATPLQAADPAAATRGQWSEVQPWPLLAVHAVLMDNGQVLAWDATPDDFDDDPHTAEVKTTRVTIWDPETGAHVQADNNTNTDLFCAGAAHLWDGDLLLAGGDDFPGGAPGTAEGASSNSNIFHPGDASWTRLENMASARWYSTVAALPSGEMLTFGGNYQVEPFAEVLGLDRRWRSLPIAAQMPYPYSGDYQWLQVRADGQVASFGPHNTLGLLDTAGAGLWRTLPGARDEVPYRGYGSFAPFAPGQVLVTGGVGYYTTGPVSERSAVVLDLDTMRPRPTADMLYPRSQHNLTVLPDGTVLATGGHGSGAALIDLDAPVLASELWDPQTEQWRELAPLARTRQYHSVGLLLPDARVLVAGGGYCGPCDTFDYHEQSAEVFSPPYLFNDDGSEAPRPQLADVPERVNYGASFGLELRSDKALERLVLLKPGSTTHSHNQEQRYIPLDWSRDGDRVTARAPAHRNLAPPGHYLLFAVDADGVPSHGEFVLVGQPSVVAGQAVSQRALAGELDVYAVESYAGDAALRVSLTDIRGDADLYLRRDDYPDGEADGDYDCGSARFGDGDEVCQILDPGRHTWYVGVSAWEDSDYQLRVSLQADDSQPSGQVDPDKHGTRVNPAGPGSSGGGGGSGGGGALALWALASMLGAALARRARARSARSRR